MKYKKYILLLLLLLVIGINKTYADTVEDFYDVTTVDSDGPMCYYIGDGFRASMDLYKNDIYVDRVGNSAEHNSEKMSNYCEDIGLAQRSNTTEAGHKFSDYNFWCNKLEKCPKYLVFQYCDAYRVWGTESESEAASAASDINNVGCTGKYASSKNKNGQQITEREYYSSLVDQELVGKEIPKGKECDSIFGDENDSGGVNPDGTERGASIRYIVNMILKYVRIIVPIIIVILGSLDLAKAVIAGKEDEMKSAQKKFIMRIVAGIIVFLAPAIVNIIMWLADITWQGLGYSTCSM